ncbi:MAG: hypothetical protein HKN34_05145 [Gammaproteobacteria bacterium]|nr:hypothetical protein [Gammaproteobacteria bacterium]
MTWLIFISHAFNPLIIAIGLGALRSEYRRERRVRVSTVLGLTVSSLLIYLIWLALHYALTFVSDIEFNFSIFIGVDREVHYFLPFLTGALLVINESVIRPLLKMKTQLAANDGLLILMIFFGSYSMLVNYMSWISSLIETVS